jgi:hypothetical protein
LKKINEYFNLNRKINLFMEIFKTLIFGKPNTFNLFGIKISFNKKENNDYYKFFEKNLILRNLAITAENLLNNYAFKLITFGYLHTFVHEMGHGIALKILSGKNISIEININTCLGLVRGERSNLSAWSMTLFDLAGPLADVILSISLIYASCAFNSLITPPLAIILGAGGAIWLVGEYYYAVDSLISGRGDMASIASHGNLHLLIASAALITPCALAILLI